MVPVIIYQDIVLYIYTHYIHVVYILNIKSMKSREMFLSLTHYLYEYTYGEMFTFIEIDHELKA